MGVSGQDVSLIASNQDSAHSHRVRDGRPDTAGEEAAEDAGKGASAGAVIGGAGGLLAGLGMLAIPGLGPVVAAGRPQLPALSAARLSAGPPADWWERLRMRACAKRTRMFTRKASAAAGP